MAPLLVLPLVTTMETFSTAAPTPVVTLPVCQTVRRSKSLPIAGTAPGLLGVPPSSMATPRRAPPSLPMARTTLELPSPVCHSSELPLALMAPAVEASMLPVRAAPLTALSRSLTVTVVTTLAEDLNG